MALASDPDDLSLKVRKLFPQIEDRVREGGDMAPSYSDFSQITELMDIKKLYEEQEVQWRQRITDKDAEIETLKNDLEYRVETLTQQKARPGLCAVNPDRPLQYGEMAWLLPRGDVVFKAWVDQWLHLAKASGEYDRTLATWIK